MVVADLTNWVPPAEAGRLLGLGPDQARRLADRGVLEAHRTRLGRLISLPSVQRLRAERDARQTPDPAA
jgi:hypothetical protein